MTDLDEHRHTVIDGELQHVSASQIKLFRACPRKWYCEKVLRLPRPVFTKATAIGTDVHAQIEHYLTTGEDVLGVIARAGKKFLPVPKTPGMLVEHEIELKWASVPICGAVDLALPEMHAIFDHKTCSSIERSFNDALGSDAQCQIYSIWMADEWSLEVVRFTHIYYQTKAPRSTTSSVYMSRSALETARDSLKRTIDDMIATARQKELQAIVSDDKHCRAYGGCPYITTCKPPPPLWRKSMGLLSGKKTTAASAIETPAPTASVLATTPTTASVPQPETVSSIIAAEVSTVTAKDCKIGRQYLVQYQVAIFKGQAGPHYLFQHGPAPTDIIQVAADEKVEPLGGISAPSITPPDAPEPVKAEPPPVKSAPPPMKAEPHPEPEKKTRKRASKKSAEPVAAGEVALFAEESEPKPLEIFVDCIPSTPYEDLGKYVNQKVADLKAQCEMSDADDIRVQDQGPLAFGKWQGHLAQLVKADLPNGKCVIFTTSLSGPVIEALAEVATLVVRGVK